MTTVARADVCAVAIAEAFRGDGEILCNPIGTTPMVLVVNPQRVPAKDHKEFQALLKAKPGQYNFASGGNGTILHLATELYLAGGIRCAELGSLYLGELDDGGELLKPAPYELVRLAIERHEHRKGFGR